MSSRHSQLLRIVLPCDQFAPRLARRAVGALAAIEPVRDDVLVVTTELVSNAVLSTGCDAGDQIEVVAELVPQTVRITVSDVQPPDAERSRRDTSYGHPESLGLRIVDRLTRNWGVEHDPRTRLWAELPFTSSGSGHLCV